MNAQPRADLQALRPLRAGTEVVAVDAVVDHPQPCGVDTVFFADLPCDHARVADHCPQHGAGIEACFLGQLVAVVQAQRLTERAAPAACPIAFAQPDPVHAAAGAIKVTAGDACLRLDEIGLERRQRPAGGTRKADLAPQPPHVKRIAAHHRDVGIRAGSIPAARDHGEAYGVFTQGCEHAREDALGAAVRPVGGMDERDVQRRGHADGSRPRRRRSSTKACFANAAKADEAAIRMPRQPSRQAC